MFVQNHSAPKTAMNCSGCSTKPTGTRTRATWRLRASSLSYWRPNTTSTHRTGYIASTIIFFLNSITVCTLTVPVPSLVIGRGRHESSFYGTVSLNINTHPSSFLIVSLWRVLVQLHQPTNHFYYGQLASVPLHTLYCLHRLTLLHNAYLAGSIILPQRTLFIIFDWAFTFGLPL